jgi:hypothetical protein
LFALAVCTFHLDTSLFHDLSDPVICNHLPLQPGDNPIAVNNNNNNNKNNNKRHDRVGAQIHFNICKETGVQLDKKHWYERVPKSVVTNQEGKVTILWNQQVQTDRSIPNNKPDITIRDNEKQTCVLIDVAIPGNRNVINKEAEKILKYKDLVIEIQRMCNVKATVITVIIGATGTISKSLRQCLSNIPGKHEIEELQKNNNIGHCTHTTESAHVKV